MKATKWLSTDRVSCPFTSGIQCGLNFIVMVCFFFYSLLHSLWPLLSLFALSPSLSIALSEILSVSVSIFFLAHDFFFSCDCISKNHFLIERNWLFPFPLNGVVSFCLCHENDIRTHTKILFTFRQAKHFYVKFGFFFFVLLKNHSCGLMFVYSFYYSIIFASTSLIQFERAHEEKFY